MLKRFPGILLLLFFPLFCSTAWAWESELYDAAWSPTPASNFDTDKLIQDFSYAGYHRGERPIPDITGPVFDVVSGFGADPTGSNDSTDEIQNALDAAVAAGGGVVYLPAGTYLVAPSSGQSSALQLSGSNVVVRGAGKQQTFLLNTSHEMRSKRVIDVTGASPYWYWGNGTFYEITEDLLSPTLDIPVADTSPFTPGDWILIRNDVTSDWINEHNEPGWLGFESNLGGIVYSRQIVAIDSTNNTLRIDAPTRYALKTRDNARVVIRNNALSEVGLEDFSIGNVQHPGTNWGESDYTDENKSAYDTHASYLVNFKNVRNSWVRRIDSFQVSSNTTGAHMLSNGFLFLESRGLTIEDCHLQRPQYGGGGGNGYMFRLGNTNESLVQNCTAEFSRHGLVFSHMGSSGNVLHNCLDKTTGKATGSSGSYNTSGKASDHHMRFSHSNLIDVCTADGSWFTAHYRPYGSDPKHNLTSAHSVYWNTEGISSPIGKVVHTQQSRYGYVVGTRGAVTAVETGGHSTEKTAPVDHVEGTGLGASLDPFSLYLDQLRNRLALPDVDAGPDLSLFFPTNGTRLNSRVLFGNSETIPATGEILWTQTSGPLTVIFEAPDSATPRVALPGPGTYTFKCKTSNSAYDISEAVNVDEVQIVVAESNISSEEILPTDDAYVWGGNTDGNFGSTSTLWLKSVDNVDFERQSLMRFDLSSLQGKTVAEARLELHATEPQSGMVSELHSLSNDNWNESTLTWANKPASSGILEIWSPDSSLEQELDLTPAVRQEAAGDKVLSLQFKVQSQSNNSTIFRYHSKESAIPSTRPLLKALLSRTSSISFEDWIDSYSSLDPGEMGFGDDPDRDLIFNGAELFHSLDPETESGFPLPLQKDGTGYFLDLSLNPDLPESAWLRLEFNADPSQESWKQLPGAGIESTAQENEYRIRLPNQIDQSENTALRMVYVLNEAELSLNVPLRIRALDVITSRISPQEINLSWQDAGAVLYRVFSNTINDFESALRVTETSELFFVDRNSDPAVTHFYWVVAMNAAGIQGQSGPGTQLDALLPRPDLLIGKRWTSLRGNDRYSTAFRYRIKTRIKKKEKAMIAVESDELPEEVQMRGPAGNRFFKIAYYRVNGGRSNITSAMKRGSFSTGADAVERIEMQLRSIRSRQRVSKFRVTGKSSNDPAIIDGVQIEAKSR